jgi:hypothetical protein
MNEMHPTRNDTTGACWVFFGEFEAPVEQNMTQSMCTWLAETLRPLHLKADFLEKVITSAQKAAEGGFGGDPGTGRLTIRVYANSASQASGQTWGFFRTEKKDRPPADEPYRKSITFYLYLEGK